MRVLCVVCVVCAGAVLGGFLGFPETPSEIARAPTIHVGDKKLQRVIYIMAFPIGKTLYFCL